MAREILFKAKRKCNGEWVEGSPVFYESGEVAIFNEKFTRYGHEATQIWKRTLVDESTICQYTGLTDKNGNKIWGNDVVYIPSEDEYFKVEWNKDTASFVMNGDGVTVTFDNYWPHEVEVYGSSFDIGELLGGGE